VTPPISHQMVDENRPCEQQDECRIGPAVENQAGENQPSQSPDGSADPARYQEPEQRDGQETEDECWRVEQHAVTDCAAADITKRKGLFRSATIADSWKPT